MSITTEPTQPLVLTVSEAGKLLRIGRSQAYAAVRAGEIPAVRIGGSLRVPRHQLEKMFGPLERENEPA